MTVSWGRTIAFVLAAGSALCTASYGLQSAPQVCSGNCVFRVGVFDGSSAEFVQGQPNGEVDIFPARASRQETIQFHLKGDPSAAYRLKVALLFEGPCVPAMRLTINDKTGMYYP